MTPAAKVRALPTHGIREKIRAIIRDRGAGLVHAYYRQGGPFAAAMFDSLGDNPEMRFTADDLVAASLLDVRFGPPAVTELLISRSLDPLLAAIPGREATLWDVDLDLSSGSPSWSLWQALVAIPGLGGTRASKLLARKRPHLFPILDTVVRDHLGLGNEDAWAALGEALLDADLRASIDGLATSITPTPSTLRLLDVVTWMRYSESGNARAVREDLGFDVPPR